MPIYCSLVLITQQPGQWIASSCQQRDPVSAKALLWPQRLCHDYADNFLCCKLGWWEAGALGLLWPSLPVSPRVGLRGVCICFPDGADQGCHPLPGSLLLHVSSFSQLLSSWGWKLFPSFLWRELSGQRTSCGEGSPKSPLLNNPWTVLSLQLVLRHLNNSSSLNQGTVLLLTSIQPATQLVVRPCLNPIIFIKNFFKSRKTTSQPYSPNRLVVVCLVLTPLCFLWRERQWCWCQWWCC